MRFTNNECTIVLHTDAEMGMVRPELVAQEYDQVTISGEKFWYRKTTDWYKFVAKSFDYALPQSFFNEYLNKYGERPLGVWCYDEDLGCSKVLGDFLSRRAAMVLSIDKILEMWDRKADKETGRLGERM